MHDPHLILGRHGMKRVLKCTVRLTRREIIFIESLLRAANNDMLRGVRDGFNASIPAGVRPIGPMIALEAERLADRLSDVEQATWP